MIRRMTKVSTRRSSSSPRRIVRLLAVVYVDCQSFMAAMRAAYRNVLVEEPTLAGVVDAVVRSAHEADYWPVPTLPPGGVRRWASGPGRAARQVLDRALRGGARSRERPPWRRPERRADLVTLRPDALEVWSATPRRQVSLSGVTSSRRSAYGPRARLTRPSTRRDRAVRSCGVAADAQPEHAHQLLGLHSRARRPSDAPGTLPGGVNPQASAPGPGGVGATKPGGRRRRTRPPGPPRRRGHRGAGP